MTRSKEVLNRSQVTTNTFTFTYEGWLKIADRIGEIDLYAFSDPAHRTMEQVRDRFSLDDFTDPQLINVLLKGPDGLVIGYSQAETNPIIDRARIVRTAILPGFQGQGLVGPLMDAMEDELRRRGIKDMERNVRIENGYADAIRRHYSDRIIMDKPAEFTQGQRQFFLIEL